MTRRFAPSAQMLADILRDPEAHTPLDMQQWVGIITIARAEQLLGTLACRLEGMDLPPEIAVAMADARLNVEYQRRTALWEADCARRALEGYAGRIVLMKGTAYVAANLMAGEGRHIGDLDIMVAEGDLREVERLLFEKGGWEWVKEDAYDDAYYRTHMHELPPMIHKERDRMIDVHHTILPKTARPTPDAKAMLDASIPLSFRGGARGGASPPDIALADRPPSQPSPLKGGGLYIFSPEDMVCHCAAHLIADGDLTGGLRNLWDMHCLLTEFSGEGFWVALKARAEHHQLWPAVHRAARLASQLFGTDIPAEWDTANWQDKHYIRRLLARNQWGQGIAKPTRFAFYIRSHLLRMPPLMLARHLWTKWRKG